MPHSFVIPWTVAHQAPLSMGFPRQEYWTRVSSQPRDRTHISCIGRRVLYQWATNGSPVEDQSIWLEYGGSEVKASACNAGDLGLIPGSGGFPWRRKWQPTPVFLPGEFDGQRSLVGYSPWDGERSLVGYSPWGHKESDTTEQLHFHFIIISMVPSGELSQASLIIK